MRWLHISDPHFAFSEIEKQNPYVRSMWKRLPRILDYIEPVDCLFITGDLRNAKGRKDGNYPDGMIDTLNKVREAFDIRKDRTFIVPGNHDVDRSKTRYYLAGVQEQYQKNGDVLSPDDIEQIQGGFRGFQVVYKELCDRPFPEKFHDWTTVTVQGESFNIICLDTALFCGQGGNETGTLVVGKSLIDHMFEQISENNFPSIVLAHHDWQELEESEQPFLLKRMKEARVALYLCGHTHHTKTRIHLSDKNSRHHIFVGGTFQYQSSQKAGHEPDTDVLVGQIYPNGHGYVQAFRWEKRIEEWLPDSVFSYEDSQGNATDGIYYFPYREKAKTRQYRNVGAAYLDYLKTRCGKIELQNSRTENPDATLDRIFIKPHFIEASYHSEEARLQTLKAGMRDPVEMKPYVPEGQISVEGLLRAVSQKPVFILADPGGGKSTLLRWLAKECAEVYESTRPEEKETLRGFPVWIQSRDIRMPSERDDEESGNQYPLLFAAVEHSAKRANLTPNKLFHVGGAPSFAQMVKERFDSNGAILLLIDGIDEIADEALCKRMLWELEHIAKDCHHVKLIVTLRYTGFTMLSALSEEGKERFGYYRIAPLNQADVVDFCKNWYALYGMEKGDNTLAGRIIKDKNASRLAVNPLLLTLMLLVCGKNKRIPSTAAALYAAEARLLLERWAEDGNVSVPLDTEEVRLQLAYIAFYVAMNKSDEISEHDLLALLRNMRNDREELIFQNSSEQDFLRNIQTRNALLLPSAGGINGEADGERNYEFQHPAFTEYFAALSVERKCYPNYHTDERPLSAFGENAYLSRTPEIIVLCAAMNADCARMLAEDFIKKIESREVQVGSELWASIKGILLRFLAENVPLKRKTVWKILEIAFPDGITDKDPRVLYWILRSRYATFLNDYFDAWGQQHRRNLGGGLYWTSLLGILSGKPEYRNVYEYYLQRRESPSETEQIKGITAIADAVWMSPSKSNVSERIPSAAELTPAKPLWTLSDESWQALTEDLFHFAQDSASVAVRWHALRALHAWFIEGDNGEIKDFLEKKNFLRYYTICAEFIAKTQQLPPLNESFVFYSIPLCPPLETGLWGELAEGMEIVCNSKRKDIQECERNKVGEYANLLAYFLLAWRFQADLNLLCEIRSMALQVGAEIMTSTQEEKASVGLTFRFAQSLSVILSEERSAYADADESDNEETVFLAESRIQILLLVLYHLKMEKIRYEEIKDFVQDAGNELSDYLKQYSEQFGIGEIISALENELSHLNGALYN